VFFGGIYIVIYMKSEYDILIDSLYNQYIRDEKICGLKSLFKLNSIGSKTGEKLKTLMYQKYGKDFLKKISAVRTSAAAHRSRSKESYRISKERRKKMIAGVKKYYANHPEAKERSRKLMIEHCLPNSQTEIARQNRRNSRIGYVHSETTKNKISMAQKGKRLSDEHISRLKKPKKTKRTGFKHSTETKHLLSTITKMQWMAGVHKPIYKSKGQIELIDILKQKGYVVEDEHLVAGKPYDVFVTQKNMLIEFNGTYWHRDPRFYQPDDSVKIIWERDENKKLTAEDNGYIIKTIWQHDWETCKNKSDFVERTLNE